MSSTVARQPVRLTRRGRALLRILMAGLLLVFVTFCAAAVARAAVSRAAVAPGPTPIQHRLVVAPGQTLWEIALDLAPDSDPRDTVARLRQVNHLRSAEIHEGDRLILPAP